MANIKSAKKRIKTNDKARMRNKTKKTALRNAIKNLEVAIEANDKQLSTDLFKVASKKLDSGITSGICHKNYAARQKSRLMKKINLI